jgi:dTDP-4-dehydrorhamnose reductase
VIPIKNILVTGADGQLSQCFRLISINYPALNFFFCNSSDLDITNTTEVEKFLIDNKINFLINCAAYTAVDKAEEEREKALLINAEAVRMLAQVCKKEGVKLIHFSTDYVFNGNGSKPYLPTDSTDPVNFYGETKLRGEQSLLEENPAALVIRTSWVYSQFGKNFLKTMRYLLTQKTEINVVADQFGSPTYAVDLAEAVIQIVNEDKPFSGIYHYCNEGIISWYDFSVAIKNNINSTCIIHPITTAQFPTATNRPAYSALNTDSFKKDFDQAIPLWEVSLSACLSILND